MLSSDDVFRTIDNAAFIVYVPVQLKEIGLSSAFQFPIPAECALGPEEPISARYLSDRNPDKYHEPLLRAYVPVPLAHERLSTTTSLTLFIGLG